MAKTIQQELRELRRRVQQLEAGDNQLVGAPNDQSHPSVQVGENANRRPPQGELPGRREPGVRLSGTAWLVRI